ncbi:MAG: gamma-glutamyltransferase family protein [Gemmatimonas sp.]|uniref:gamma-glutamyltransferase family protein n=1 Tax=Gemmatimonas sp. TaxID=1962908 RepID=UPI0025C67581|nr:gamma-glutamyltransferase [Gemmatimonas sp.]MCE2952551.1 gamma-glutamyltransferase family protein [Gemmatimonas sp.]
MTIVSVKRATAAASVVLLLAACTRSAPVPLAAPMAGKRVEGDRGMVAASHPDAAAAGAALLGQGGNAIDAYVATAFALSVTDVSQTGLGGGGAMTFYDASARRVQHLSFYPRTGANPEWARPDSSRGRAMGRAAATPGMVAGLLEAHGNWGRLPLAQVMAPAIRLARDGFIVSPLLARTIERSRDKMMADSLAMRRFMPGGRALRPGERLVQPELANTLERIRDGGRTAFYGGDIAERLSAKVQARGGLISVTDMERYVVLTVRPLCTAWRQYTVLGAPPPMGGASVLAMLQMADRSGVANAGGFTSHPEAVVKMADIMRLAGADANRWRGDPVALRVPARGASSASFAAVRAGLVGGALPDTVPAGDAPAFDGIAVAPACAGFDPYPAQPVSATAPGEAGDMPAGREPSGEASREGESFTSHLSVVDGQGNAVSATTTVGVLFGSGVYTDGFWLNSSASNFDARTRGTERYANSTMSPTLVLEGNAVRLVIGAAGSQYIQPAIAQVTLRTLAFGEDPWTAIAAPRIHASAASTEVEVEPGFSSEVYAALVRRGYRPESRVADITFGGVHAVYVSPRGRRIGVADPRRDGVAARQ